MDENGNVIVIPTKAPSLEDFKLLMSKTDFTLNNFARNHEEHFIGKNGTELEKDVFAALKQSAKGTPFEGQEIKLVSGSSFPDIVAGRYYGVEVKSTKENKWKSIGSSILESTRIKDVERIFITFGKLGSPVRFRSRPYEECLYDISITHYPRYQIDMELKPGETIFDKMRKPYEELRQMSDPVKPVAEYYKSRLKPGQTLWWAGGAEAIESTSIAPYISIWNTLDSETQKDLLAKGYAYFPELLTQQGPGIKTKYNRFTLWIAQKGIVSPNVRDACSAGGKADVHTWNGLYPQLPAVFLRVHEIRKDIWKEIVEAPIEVLEEYWQERIENGERRIDQWCQKAAKYAVKAPSPKDPSIITYDIAFNCLLSSLYTDKMTE